MNKVLNNINDKITTVKKYTVYAFGLVLLAGFSAGCSVNRIQKDQVVSKQARWVLLPIVNLAEVPQAGERIESVIETFLYSKGIRSLAYYPRQSADEALLMLDERSRYSRAMQWAKTQDFDYAITGSIEEWGYKSGLDGEPAVGLSLRILDMKTGKVIWSASGAKTGWGYDSVSGVAISLVNKLLNGIDIE